jgi:dynactin complex subunit
VRVLSSGRCATVRFIGHTKFAHWELIGLQMDIPSDDYHDGKGYFDVPDGSGMFVRRKNLEMNPIICQYESPI